MIILDLSGQIRLGAGNVELRAAITGLVNRGAKNVILNLEEVSKIDSSGLGEIIASHTSLKKNGGSLKLLNLTTHVRELMVITKLLTVLDSYKTESDAVKSFRHFFTSTEKSDQRSMPGYTGL